MEFAVHLMSNSVSSVRDLVASVAASSSRVEQNDGRATPPFYQIMRHWKSSVPPVFCLRDTHHTRFQALVRLLHEFFHLSFPYDGLSLK